MMAPVEYLGHKVTAEGLHAMESKLDAIVQALKPKRKEKSGCTKCIEEAEDWA